MPSAVPLVLEREAELSALEAAIDRAAAGEGGVVLVEGPAGIGKSLLLREARRLAAASGVATLTAVASELDRDFPFGLAHQLLDPVLGGADDAAREALLRGAARRAAVVLDPAAEPLGTDPGHAVLDGLHWLLANLADTAPHVLLVEDLHWADRASLRLLEYLGRRIEDLPLCVVGTLRPGEPGAEAELLDALAAGPAVAVLRPQALGTEAVAAMVADALGAAPEDGFAAACATATGGNPLLLRALARDAAEQGLQGQASEAEKVAALGAQGLARTVERRLVALGPDAVAVARAAAVLGERRSLEDLAVVAGRPAEDARAAVDRLVAADLLEPERWAFVHPLLRAAVARATPRTQQLELHARAAARLDERGVAPAEIAVHLLATEPGGDARTVACLRAAARSAAAEGAPETAVTLLRRALAEPPAPEPVRAAVLLDLGELELSQGDARGREHLDAALEAGLDGDAAARAHVALGTHLLMSAPAPALDAFDRAAALVEDDGLRLRIEALTLESTLLHTDLLGRRRELLAAPGEVSPVRLVHRTIDAAYAAAPAAEVRRLLDDALRDGRFDRDVGPRSNSWNVLVHALRYAEATDRAKELMDLAEEAGRRDGTLLARVFVEHARAWWHFTFGSVAAGAAYAQTGLEEVRRAGFRITEAAFAAPAVELLLAQDRVDEAAAALAPVDVDAAAETISGVFAVSARGMLHRARGDRVAAEADFRRAHGLAQARGWRAPLVGRAGLRLAHVLGDRGAVDEALALADAMEADARSAATHGALGMVLALRGRLVGGDDGVDLLRAAVDELAVSPLRLEHGWALHDLGATLRRAGRRAEARDPLREALDAAARCQATGLARVAREELAATGVRPQRDRLGGVEALTPSERRVADLAAAGLGNREIAEQLWVTRKTVEQHLGNVYSKLGIRGRRELPGVLGTEAVAA